MVRLAAIAVVLAGCDAVFGLRNVPKQDAADVVSAGERQFFGVVILGAIHDAVEEPGQRRVPGTGEDRGVRRGTAPCQAPQYGRVLRVRVHC